MLGVVTVERYGLAAVGPAVVTAAEMVAGHVRLDVSCLDRLYLNGYVNKLQTPGGVVYFFHDHRGNLASQVNSCGEHFTFRADLVKRGLAGGLPTG
jgi:hypothetical protein